MDRLGFIEVGSVYQTLPVRWGATSPSLRNSSGSIGAYRQVSPSPTAEREKEGGARGVVEAVERASRRGAVSRSWRLPSGLSLG